ncbi:hypothetical protein Hypma_011175 [Hypsizygus marmoreus]|uniref:Uncharacterized protein n=1 Tax=Hypsizygus marmoreus TaxID=39966 RepID=A0A369JIF0_HYPMA|nr:hypothetical protein Hypma_011175 [Hypsizygus marmoreus]
MKAAHRGATHRSASNTNTAGQYWRNICDNRECCRSPRGPELQNICAAKMSVLAPEYFGNTTMVPFT